MKDKSRFDEKLYSILQPRIEKALAPIVRQYGADFVKEALKNFTQTKRGRKEVDDNLYSVFFRDAEEWLSGGDPFLARTSHAIAVEIADNEPGHSHSSTVRRLTNKLTPKARRLGAFECAVSLSQCNYPYRDYLRALEALVGEDPTREADVYKLNFARELIASYEAHFGEPPPGDASFATIDFFTDKETFDAGSRRAHELTHEVGNNSD